MKKIEKPDIPQFQADVLRFYQQHGRPFAWRHISDPYKVFVSEIMLQQTQTSRVIEKYNSFIDTFPTVHTLAQASLADVLLLWQGLGYNRRAKFMWLCAQEVVQKHNGLFPRDEKELCKLPSIGSYTAGAIMAFAYNIPTVFIETNIRAVFIHSFFQEHAVVHDADILPLIEQSLDTRNPRDWYYALMDYGVHIKAQFPGVNKKSSHYTKQSKFHGSNRQIRGAIIRFLTQKGAAQEDELLSCIDRSRNKILQIIDNLIDEKMISKKNNTILLGHNI